MKLNSSNSFTTVFSNTMPCRNTVHGHSLDQVSTFIYMGSQFRQFTSDGKCVRDVTQRIGIAKSVFSMVEKIGKDINTVLNPRIRVLKLYAWSTLLYGCETWSLDADMIGVERTGNPYKNYRIFWVGI